MPYGGVLAPSMVRALRGYAGGTLALQALCAARSRYASCSVRPHVDTSHRTPRRAAIDGVLGALP